MNYKVIPVPSQQRAQGYGRWGPLIDALIKYEGKAILVERKGFSASSINYRVRARGFDLHTQKQASGGVAVWVIRNGRAK